MQVELFNGIILPGGTRVPFSKKISSKVTVETIKIRNHAAYNRKGVAKQLTCTEKIAKDEYLGSYGGRISSSDEEWNPYKITPKNCNYDIDGESVGNEMRYINDAKGVGNKEPNVRFFLSYRKLRGHSTVEVISLRDIEVGEEILASYGDGYWEGLEEWYEKQNPYACDECDFRADNHQSLRIHKWNKQKRLENESRKKLCPYCEKEFTVAYFEFHLNTHTHEITFKCDSCEYTCFTQANLSTHKASKHSTDIWKCFECARTFSNTSSLKEHVWSVHEKQRPFKCDECDYTCAHRSYIKIHKRSKHGEGRIYCTYDDCDYETYTNSHLDNHIKVVHLQEKHICPTCNKAYTIKASLAEHITVIHGTKRFPCGDCDQTYKSRNALRAHIRKVHDEIVDKFPCDQCGETYSSKSNLGKHVRKAHEKKRFSCTDCDVSYTTNGNLSLHKKLKHSPQEDADE